MRIHRRKPCTSRTSWRCWSRSRACWLRSSRSPRPTTCECRSWKAANELAAALRRDQELAVTIGAGDWAVGKPDHVPASLSAEPVGNTSANLLVQTGIADDSAFADIGSTDLELRLDESDQLRRRRCKGKRRREHHLEADEAGVANNAIHGLRNISARKISC